MSAAFWLMVAVVATAGVTFVTIVIWLEARLKERQSHYRAEMARRIAEAADAEPILEYVRETERIDAARTRMKARVVGLITIAIGIALTIFFYQLVPDTPVYFVGLIPSLVGVVLLVLSEFMMKPAD